MDQHTSPASEALAGAGAQVRQVCQRPEGRSVLPGPGCRRQKVFSPFGQLSTPAPFLLTLLCRTRPARSQRNTCAEPPVISPSVIARQLRPRVSPSPELIQGRLDDAYRNIQSPLFLVPRAMSHLTDSANKKWTAKVVADHFLSSMMAPSPHYPVV